MIRPPRGKIMEEISFKEIRYQEKKQKILEKAGMLFTKKGYEKASLKEIAAKLNLKKGTLYYYVKSKDDLLFQIQMQALGKSNILINKVYKKNIDSAQKIREIITGVVKISTRIYIVGAMNQQALLLPPEMLEQVIIARKQFQDAFFQIIDDGIKEGIFEDNNSKIRTFSILGAMNWVTRWYNPQGDLTPEQIGDAMADFFIAGFSMSKPDSVLK